MGECPLPPVQLNVQQSIRSQSSELLAAAIDLWWRRQESRFLAQHTQHLELDVKLAPLQANPSNPQCWS